MIAARSRTVYMLVWMDSLTIFGPFAVTGMLRMQPRAGRILPRGRKRGIVARAQVDYSVRGRRLRYSLTLIDVHNTAAEHARVLGFENAHGIIIVMFLGQIETVELESYESPEKRFEAEV